MFGVNKDCPIRITGIIGFNKAEIDKAAKALVDEFGWRIHSEAQVQTKECIAFSIILFNLKIQ